MAGVAGDDVYPDSAEVHVRGIDTACDYPCGKAIKRIDGSDVYDEGISYKVWKIGDI